MTSGLERSALTGGAGRLIYACDAHRGSSPCQAVRSGRSTTPVTPLNRLLMSLHDICYCNNGYYRSLDRFSSCFSADTHLKASRTRRRELHLPASISLPSLYTGYYEAYVESSDQIMPSWLPYHCLGSHLLDGTTSGASVSKPIVVFHHEWLRGRSAPPRLPS